MMQYLWMFLAALTAYVSGRGVIRWTIGAYFFGWMAVILVVFLPRRQEKMEQRQEYINNLNEQLVVKQEFKEVKTVEDLFSQLDKK
jgi:hypothetical protein